MSLSLIIRHMAACSAVFILLQAGDASAQAAAAPDAAGDAQAETGQGGGEALNGLTEIRPTDFKPAFERETVIKLNSIVRRSLEVIEAFDDQRRRLTAARSAGEAVDTAAMYAEWDALHVRAIEALGDMKAEIARLEASDEDYNSAILAGMADFVGDVEAEIGAAARSVAD